MSKEFNVNPKVDNEVEVKLIQNTENDMFFYDDIFKIYQGYRQCYSPSIWVGVDLTKYDLNDLIDEAKQNNPNLDVDQFDKFSDEQVYKFFYMAKFIKDHMYHQSQLEHGKLTFQHVFSRVASHQHVRHRISSLGQQSQRYVPMEEPHCFIPRPIELNNEAATIYLDTLTNSFVGAQKIRALGDKNIKEEDIRYLYPNACKTQIVTSFNIRHLIYSYLSERCCKRASMEIRDGAMQMLILCRKNIPFIFDNAGPKCRHLGYCPELHGSCGLYKTKKEVLGN